MRSITDYCTGIFGEKAYRLSLDGGFSCPNRDGTLSSGGCTFCLGGSGDFAASHTLPIDRQIDQAKSRIAGKYRGSTFIAYFQSFTNTYAPADVLRAKFEPVIRRGDIAALAIGTRPDCLPAPVLALLAELNRIKPVWVELGLQTMHDVTAARINRGYPTRVYDEAVSALNDIGIHTVTHMILSLPGETEDMMLATADHIAEQNSGGLKIQMLNILRSTPMADEFARAPFPLMDLDAYASLTARIIRRMPDHMVLHRMTGDGPRRALIAPQWITDKKRALNAISRALSRPADK